ncbi:MAG: LPS export ABC transporter periplasmic protein LptC, partial [Oxalobacter sp.]|nr:LPS export ABC transporter periplasmic protein LptC [Oxalobacter sp.]
GPVRLTSEYVLIYPDDEIMTSDREVTISDAHSVMTGVGMQANNATSELQIFNRARITYNPPGTSKH